MKSLVIFDLDGTLLNTIADLGEATNHALAQMGYPEHPLSAYNMMVGNGIRRLIERALPEDARTDETVEAAREHFLLYYNRHIHDHTLPYPAIPELLRDLTERKVAVAVASNKFQEGVTTLITHFFPDIPWVAVMGNREGMPTKPDPSIVFNILADYPTPKSDVLYVGDSGVDMETARRACLDSCGVTWGFRSRQELETAGANYIVDTPDDILPLISRR